LIVHKTRVNIPDFGGQYTMVFQSISASLTTPNFVISIFV